MRSLIRPALGQAVAYFDWSAQEIAIAAALSGDAAMISGYQSGDPHIAFAILAGLAPLAKRTRMFVHCARRQNLGTNYGMTKFGLGRGWVCPLPKRASCCCRTVRFTAAFGSGSKPASIGRC